MARTSLRALRKLFTATIDEAIKPSTHAGLSTLGTFGMPPLGFGFEVVVGYGYLARHGPR